MMAKTVPTKSTIGTVGHRAAAVDIGSRTHMAAVNPDTAEVPVRAFGTFTHDLHDLADLHSACIYQPHILHFTYFMFLSKVGELSAARA